MTDFMTRAIANHRGVEARKAREAAGTPTTSAATLPPYQPPEPAPEVLGTLSDGTVLTHPVLRQNDPGKYITVLENAATLTDAGTALLGNLRSLAAEISAQVRRQTRAEALAAVRRTGWAENAEQLEALDELQADRARRLNLAASGKGPRITDRSGMAKTPEQLRALDRAYGLTD